MISKRSYSVSLNFLIPDFGTRLNINIPFASVEAPAPSSFNASPPSLSLSAFPPPAAPAAPPPPFPLAILASSLLRFNARRSIIESILPSIAPVCAATSLSNFCSTALVPWVCVPIAIDKESTASAVDSVAAWILVNGSIKSFKVTAAI